MMQAELAAQNFTVLAVALDSNPEKARPWIEAAKPTYPCLIDTDHRLAELYNFVNVPESVWIDERGAIVRPQEPSGAYEGFRKMDRTTFKVPDAAVATTAGARQTYYAAVRDWAVQGTSSRHALTAEQARQRLNTPGPDVALAHAQFRLGRELLQRGREAEAATAFAEAQRLHPASWAMWRQAAPLDDRGFATGEAFWARVDALGDKRYYAKVEMDGMP